jgi:hypothetical protein
LLAYPNNTNWTSQSYRASAVHKLQVFRMHEFILRIDLSISCSLNCTTFIKLIVGLLLGEMLCLQLFVYMLLLIYATLQTTVSRNAIYFDSCPHVIAIASGSVAWINIIPCNIQYC